MAPVKRKSTTAFLLALASSLALAGAEADEPAAVPSAPLIDDPITEIVIRAPEPRYVAPTRRDQIGRIWAPVYINEQGPFRLVLDTGASASSVTARVATALGLVPDKSSPVRLQGVTGSATVPTIRVNSLRVGDLLVNDTKLPIIPDALGGAEGTLGNEGLADRRVFIDFRHDLITITRSHGQRAAPGFMTIPFELERGRLLIAQVMLGRVRAKAIIDTGSQATVGNLALKDALLRGAMRDPYSVDNIEGVTNEVQYGQGGKPPPIEFGPIVIRAQHMTFLDSHIFKYWKLTGEPTVSIGMDALGLLDTLIIDFQLHELQLQMRPGS